MLLTKSLNDSQVVYWEAAKFVAKARTLKTDINPLLLKMKMDPAGHGGASGRYDQLKDTAFEYAWLLGQVGISSVDLEPGRRPKIALPSRLPGYNHNIVELFPAPSPPAAPPRLPRSIPDGSDGLIVPVSPDRQ